VAFSYGAQHALHLFPGQATGAIFGIEAACWTFFTSNGDLGVRRLLHLQALLQQDGEDPEASENN